MLTSITKFVFLIRRKQKKLLSLLLFCSHLFFILVNKVMPVFILYSLPFYSKKKMASIKVCFLKIPIHLSFLLYSHLPNTSFKAALNLANPSLLNFVARQENHQLLQLSFNCFIQNSSISLFSL